MIEIGTAMAEVTEEVGKVVGDGRLQVGRILGSASKDSF